MIEDEMVSRSYSHSGEVALAVFSVETSYMELVDIESPQTMLALTKGPVKALWNQCLYSGWMEKFLYLAPPYCKGL